MIGAVKQTNRQTDTTDRQTSSLPGKEEDLGCAALATVRKYSDALLRRRNLAANHS